jgi:hypothetical protein
MAVINTSVSSFTFNTTVFEAVGTCSISNARQLIDISQLGSLNSHFLPGVAASTIALDIYYNTAAHTLLTASITAGTPSTFKITFLTTSDEVTGSAYVTGLDIVASMGDIVRASVVLQCTGQVVLCGATFVAGGNEV